jgi:hypothetical protein
MEGVLALNDFDMGNVGLKGYELSLLSIKNPQDPKEVAAVLREVEQAKEMRIVVIDFQK